MIEDIKFKRGFMFRNERCSFTVKDVIKGDTFRYVLQVYDTFYCTSEEKTLTYPEIVYIMYGVQEEQEKDSE